MGGRYNRLQYALAVAAIWGAVGFGLWAQDHPAEGTNTLLLAVTVPLFLIEPFLENTNSFYSAPMLMATSLTLMALPLLVAAVAMSQSAKRVLGRAMRVVERELKKRATGRKTM